MKRKEIQIYDNVLSKRYMELVSNKFTYDFAWYFSAADKRKSGRVKLHLASERLNGAFIRYTTSKLSLFLGEGISLIILLYVELRPLELLSGFQ